MICTLDLFELEGNSGKEALLSVGGGGRFVGLEFEGDEVTPMGGNAGEEEGGGAQGVVRGGCLYAGPAAGTAALVGLRGGNFPLDCGVKVEGPGADEEELAARATRSQTCREGLELFVAVKCLAFNTLPLAILA